MTTISDERLAERGVEVLKRIAASKMPLADADFIAQWVHDARQSLRGGVRVRNEKWSDREPIYEAAIAAYEANTPKDYRYSAVAMVKAVDAAIATIERLSSLEASPAPVSEEMVEVVAKAISRLVPLDGSSAWVEPFGHDFPNEYSKKERKLIRQIAAAALAAKGGQ